MWNDSILCGDGMILGAFYRGIPSLTVVYRGKPLIFSTKGLQRAVEFGSEGVPPTGNLCRVNQLDSPYTREHSMVLFASNTTGHYAIY